jgi:hypothetical protein
MKVSRRDLLLGTAGLTAGIFFTPVPWKVLDDVSIWTQNWPWIPQPAHGPVTAKLASCTLCASGCAIRVRMAASFPVGVSGSASHPLTKGALCPLGFAAHQLNWHPARLREVRHHGRSASWDEARAAFEKACAEGPVGILDGRSGRAAAAVLQSFATKYNGSYEVVLNAEEKALSPYAQWTGIPVNSLGYDLENARTIVSFGAQLLDGWGVPGRFTHLWSERAAGKTDPQLRLVQIEPTLSRTATNAWRWAPICQGTEALLAASLAKILIEGHLVSVPGPLPSASLTEAATQTGLTPTAIRDLACAMVESRPTVVIGADENPAVAALNVLLGSLGARGGIVKVPATPFAMPRYPSTHSTPRAVLVDSIVPWETVAPSGSEVFRFVAWDGGGNRADWLLPAPGFLEESTDLTTPPTSAVAIYGFTPSLLTPPLPVKTAAEFLQQIDSSLPTVDQTIHTRCEGIFRARRGTVHAEKQSPVASLESAAKLEEALRAGGVWVDEPSSASASKCTLREWPTESPTRTSGNWANAWAPPVMPTLAAKLYRESSLREAPQRNQS